MEKILISACLLGEKVRYNGGDAAVFNDIIDNWKAERRLVAFCPEVEGGLPVPRPASEIKGDSGAAVLNGTAVVEDIQGDNVTAPYLKGAFGALNIARKNQIKIAVLKEKSPACGSKLIYDGNFSGTTKKGQGVTTALLEKEGIRVFSENEIQDAQRFLKELEEYES